MRSLARTTALIAAVTVAVAGWTIQSYNHLVGARLAIDAQWAQVEAQYQRRVDLVPNVVDAARGVLVQERTVFEALAEARTAYLRAPAGSEARVQAANAIERPLGRLLGIVEASPQLRSSETMARLMDELAGTENRIAVERRRYNDRVMAYNTLVQQVPGSLIAALGGFSPRSYFEAVASAGTAPAVTLPKP
jgi:LemA protein